MMLGADVGGTFTDLVLVVEGEVLTAKLPTSEHQEDAIAVGIDELACGSTVDVFVHGTTIATNALLERKGARTVLVTDAGFEDIIEIARQDRPSLYDPYADRPTPLVDRSMRIGVGGVSLPAVPEADSIAIALVNGHVDRDREQELATVIARQQPGVPVCLSSVVAGEFREYERISTTVLNAYLTPITSTYLRALDRRLVEPGIVGSLGVMRSSGGLMDVADASALPAAVLLSGPAGGVVAAAAFAQELRHDRVVSFDMGGTSTDVCRIEEGVIEVSYERSIDGYVCRLPSVGVHTVGAGGGSIAWVDPGGALRVGPRSAGAKPGPACYGQGGTAPTVTDANVVLGRIAPETKLGGRLRLDRAEAEAAIGALAGQLGLSVVDTALGIVRITEEVMAGAIRTVSVEKGSDPRGAHLLAFGGAGGLHATALARALGMSGVIIPPFAGVFSALGLLLAPPRADAQRAVLVSDDDFGPVEIAADELNDEVIAALARAGFDDATVSFSVDARYLGQAHEISVAWRPGERLADVRWRFDSVHRTRNGFDRPDDAIEIVAVRGVGLAAPALTIEDVSQWRPTTEQSDTYCDVTADVGTVSARIVARSALQVGDVIEGPAVIEEVESTTYLSPGDIAVVHESGAIEVTW
ncbi:MAG: hydantoinase/oxoprolinase family protein [Actinomycetota bacterium]|nr:hydantoinase/oxoprolinase family protein [Actinomycetota bacterium]MDK1026664.1 hydantoinase/oxoprolinase family protein [Actinomycetota bacterium]MDK1037520.1 hydantoinase/oxoprolinase family protein [Actinomycetota bacterium]MDK1292614.1 hydantoinase/oxoprolinase family protein [Actinomycetota bacterium]